MCHATQLGSWVDTSMSTDVCNFCAVHKSSRRVGDNWKPFSFGYHFSLPTFATSAEASPTSRNLAAKLIQPHIVADHVRSCSLSNCPLTHAPCLPHNFIVVSSANLHCQHASSGEKYHGKCLASTCRLRMVTVCPQMGQSFLPTFGVLRGFFSATNPFIHTVLVSPALSWHPEELASMSPALSRVHSVPVVKVTVLLEGGDGEWALVPLTDLDSPSLSPLHFPGIQRSLPPCHLHSLGYTLSPLSRWQSSLRVGMVSGLWYHLPTWTLQLSGVCNSF